MDKRASVIRKIEQLINNLSNPLPPSEIANGWSEESRQAMLKFFKDLHFQLMSGQFKLAEHASFHLVRGMDHWGIIGGDLLKQASEIQSDLHEILFSG
jgi:hypothetical protein